MGFLDAFRDYSKRYAPGCRAYLVQLASYSDRVAPTSEPNIRYIYGWSDEVLRYIGQLADGGLGNIERAVAALPDIEV